MGVKRFFPGVLIKDYQGFFVPEYYVSHDITSYEQVAGTTPDEILVVSSLLIDQKRKYCPNLVVSTAPAFRFRQKTLCGGQEPKEASFILVGLPIQKDMSWQIVECCLGLPEELKARLRVRPHPWMGKREFEQIMHNVGLPAELFVFEGGGIYIDGMAPTLLVSSGSSLCAEAINAGIKVAIIGNLRGVTMNPLANRLPANWWKACYSAEDIVDLYLSGQYRTPVNAEIFTPVTHGGLEKMLDFRQRSLGSSIKP